MKFFIPLYKNPEETEKFYQAIKQSALSTTGYPLTERRIFKLEFQHNGIKFEDEVGEITDTNHEYVIAILESEAWYLVCTPSRGALVGTPMYVGKHDTSHVEDFGA
jgi:hypothetical protein